MGDISYLLTFSNVKLHVHVSLALIITCINQGSADKLFNLCAEFAADSTKKKVQIMPLQNTVLILCPVSFAHECDMFIT